MIQIKEVLKVKNLLLTLFTIFMVLTWGLVILCECGVITTGAKADDVNFNFISATVMELLTLCTIPLVLRLFHFRAVKAQLASHHTKALAKWGTIRMMLLGIVTLANAVLYYLTMNAAFGYLGIISMLCFFFIFPSLTRCMNEAGIDEEEDKEA
ncbi:MAG: hypothetical protein II562_00620 [Prevotella sp.]|nr:hypothetical protein [Prevotella sp.]